MAVTFTERARRNRRTAKVSWRTRSCTDVTVESPSSSMKRRTRRRIELSA
jgi:hypothetical protein